jgi:hypothetical protein
MWTCTFFFFEMETQFHFIIRQQAYHPIQEALITTGVPPDTTGISLYEEKIYGISPCARVEEERGGQIVSGIPPRLAPTPHLALRIQQ